LLSPSFLHLSHVSLVSPISTPCSHPLCLSYVHDQLVLLVPQPAI
jgi:hypothetical protein